MNNRWKFATIVLLLVIVGYIGISALRPDISQRWNEELNSLFRNTPRIILATPTPEPQVVVITPFPTTASTATSTSPIAPATPTVVPTATLTQALAPTATSHPPSGLRETRLQSAREYALQLINEARTAAGLNELTLDDNPAAQSHANDMRENCFSSHWGSDGLKPYMRYTLEGGEEYSSENVSGWDFCPTDPDRYVSITIDTHIEDTMDGLMSSPGLRSNILNPHHTKVGIGIAYRRPNLWLTQLFVGDYVEYHIPPEINGGELTLSGQVKNGASISEENALGIQIRYDLPPHPLARGQLTRTYCYSSGLPIASLRRPPTEGWFYTEDFFTNERSICPDPYDVDVNAPAPRSYDQADQLWKQAYSESQSAINSSFSERWITATEWSILDQEFAVSADIAPLIELSGDGVYTIVLWAQINGEDVPISQYSIFIPPIDDTQMHISPTPIPSPTPVPTATPEIDVRELEDLTHELINVQRLMHGVDPLEHVEAIRLIARSHSEDMALRDYFAHDTPEGLDPTDRAESAGYDCRKDYGSYYTFGLTENIHQGWLFARYQIVDGKTTPHGVYSLEEIAQNAVQGWMNSPGHRKSILDSSFDRAGMGIAITDDGKVFFTQNFC